jgi:hypothetical protein
MEEAEDVIRAACLQFERKDLLQRLLECYTGY